MSVGEHTLLHQLHQAGLPLPARQVQFQPSRKWTLDFAYETLHLAIEVDGAHGRHHQYQGYERDCEKRNAATLAGWRVLNVTTAMVRDGRALQTLRDALAVWGDTGRVTGRRTA